MGPRGPSTADSTVIVLLGTHGTFYTPPGGSGVGTAILVGTRLFVFDAGDGALHQLAVAGLRINHIEAAFLTSLRADHVLGVPALIMTPAYSGRESPVRLYGPPGTRQMVERFLSAFEVDRSERGLYTMPSGQPHGRPDPTAEGAGTDVTAGVVYDSAGVRITAIAVDHWPSKYQFGYRIDTPDRSIVISGDTRPNEAIVRAAMNVDVLIHNVYAEAKVNSPEYFSLALTSAKELGMIAARAKPRLLILTHILPNGRAEDSELLDGIRKGGYAGRVLVGVDLGHY